MGFRTSREVISFRSMDPKLEPEHELPTGALIRRAVDEARMLVKAEIIHAKQELKDDLNHAKLGGIFLGIAVSAAVWGVALLFVLLAFAFAKPALGALIVGLGLLVVAGACAFLAIRSLPRKPLSQTRDRVKTDLAITRERLA